MSEKTEKDEYEEKLHGIIDDAKIRIDEILQEYQDFYQKKTEERGFCPTIDDFEEIYVKMYSETKEVWTDLTKEAYKAAQEKKEKLLQAEEKAKAEAQSEEKTEEDAEEKKKAEEERD